MIKEILVCEPFMEEKITKDMINDAQFISDYWSSAGLFIIENWTTPVRFLSAKQKHWMERILEDLTEMRIEGKI